MINQFDLEEVRLIKKDENNLTHVKEPTQKLLVWAGKKDFALKHFAVPNNELLLAKGVILCEGPSDRIAISNLARLWPSPLDYRHPFDLDQHDISLIATGGKCAHLFATFLERMGIPWFAIVDRDVVQQHIPKKGIKGVKKYKAAIAKDITFFTEIIKEEIREEWKKKVENAIKLEPEPKLLDPPKETNQVLLDVDDKYYKGRIYAMRQEIEIDLVGPKTVNFIGRKTKSLSGLSSKAMQRKIETVREVGSKQLRKNLVKMALVSSTVQKDELPSSIRDLMNKILNWYYMKIKVE